mmetsp:Transcript_7888/g.13295  ORF Transcript_7888/g.13295 Transcript_7888/m.13295 type:complete len:1219 (+) Transcript_7888:167-3823(+)
MATEGSDNVELIRSTKGSDISKDVTQLISTLDTIYELHSFLPQHPDKDSCVTFLKSGVCTAKCRFHHPLVTRPDNDSPSDELHDLIYILERTASLIKVVSHDATQPVANVIKPVCQILVNRFDYYTAAECDYGDVAYLYDDCSLRLLANMRSFLDKKPSPKQYFKKVYQVKPPTNSPMSVCITELRLIQERYQQYENSFHQSTEEYIASPLVVANVCDSLSAELHENSAAASAVHEMNQTVVHSTQEHIQSVLQTVWKTDDDPSCAFTIEPCGLTPAALCITPHSAPLCFVVSRRGHTNSLSNEQCVKSLSLALSNNGYSVVTTGEHERRHMLTVVRSEQQETGAAQQPIQLLVNDHVACLNTRLISLYSSQYPCFRPLVLAVQQWARVRGCGNPDNATLSSYGWTLLVINFLRLQEKEPISSIESMEKSGVLRNNANANVSTTAVQSSPAENIQSEALSPPLGVLLLQFFLFYGTCSSNGFQPFHSIVTIRNQHRVFKRDSHFTNEANANVPCMTALEAIQALSPENCLQKSIGSSSESVRRSVPPASDNDVDDGSDFPDDDNTDREISSNTSSHHSRGARRQQMLVYKSGIPSWRFCIEDPLEDIDIAAAIYSRVGQRHIMNEIRRALNLLHDISPDSNNNQEEGCRSYWKELCEFNEEVPSAVKTCRICGQEGHLQQNCELLQCHLCHKNGHFTQDCLLNFCSNCRRQGHLAKDCELPKICRNCKQTGHIFKDCPLSGCAKCGSKKHSTLQCSQFHPATDKDSLHKRVYKRGKSVEKSPATANVIDHSILPQFQRDRLDSFDIECDLGSRQSGSSRSNRRKRRSNNQHSHQLNQQHQSQHFGSLGERLTSAAGADGKHRESKATPKESKVVPKSSSTVPELQMDSTSQSRMPWISASNSPRPTVSINTHLAKKKFFTDIYSPQNSPYASPREWASSVAPGKLSIRIAGAMHKPAGQHQHQQSQGAKKVPRGSARERPPRSRSRTASLRATTSAGYSSASPNQRLKSSPVLKPKSDHMLRAESKVVDAGDVSKIGAKPTNLKLQKKSSLPAKAEPRDRSLMSSPVRSLNDIKLSSSGSRDFTTPYSPNNSTHSSPDTFSPGKKVSLTARMGVEAPQVKRENKRLSRYQRKKQAKRDGAKQTVYIEDPTGVEDWDHSTGLSILQRKDSKGVAAAKSTSYVDSAADDRYARTMSGMHHKAEEKRAASGVTYSDYLDYI